jgi:predicted amino acid dehydrogenase
MLHGRSKPSRTKLTSREIGLEAKHIILLTATTKTLVQLASHLKIHALIMPRGYKKNLNKEQQLGVSKIELRGGGSTSRNSAKKKGSKPIAKSIYTDLSICRRRAGKLRRKLEALDTLDCDICETVDDI